MPLFECQKCHCVENTATGAYWGREEKICSECETGEWHGVFPKRHVSETKYVTNERGLLEPPGGWK